MREEPSEVVKNTPFMRCKNCGSPADAAFCPQCGQSTKTTVPSLWGFLQEALGTLFSYDHKLWQTLRLLLIRPGQLTVDYIEGKRVRYLTPFQVFFWLQTITFLAYQRFFNSQAGAADLMSRELLFIGGFVAVMLALLQVRHRQPFLVHLVAAVHVWAFLMVLLLGQYLLTPLVATALHRLHWVKGTLNIGFFVTRSSELIVLLYMVRAVQVIYGDPLWKATLKTLLLFGLYRVLIALVPGL